MAGMEIDSSPQRGVSLSPCDRIVQRLAMRGIPQVYLHQFQLGLVSLIRNEKCGITDMVSCILPTDFDISDAQMLSNSEIVGGSGNFTIKELFDESIWWLQWLMFYGDPHKSLSHLLQISAGQRAVCGAVWGQNDLAYRCRTCEHDPTCAICVSCFQNGNHKDHDYNIMYTGGGCCDCGDETAWRKEGFCSMHKGIEEIRPLPQELANSMGPVLDSLFSCWKDRLLSVPHRRERDADHDETCRKAADGLSTAIIQMLLDFCNCSESLLGFLCRRMTACSRLLDILLKAERFLDKEVVKKLHELLLKLLGDPVFKYDFAKTFIQYYPNNMKEIINECSDSFLERYPMLSTFSVQIFTVPTLTVRLVNEVDLLPVLLGCLKDLFLSCVDVDGHIQVSKWANMYETTIRLIEDTRYVMSHQEVQVYIAHERPDISRAWIFLLKLVQGMDAQTRVTGIITEEENENLPAPFVLGHYLGNINALLVGALSAERNGGSEKKQDADDTNGQRHAKVGRVSQESSASRTCVSDALPCIGTQEGESCSSLSSVVWLISECLKAIECWLRPEIEPLSHSSYDIASSSGSNMLAQRKKLFRVQKGTNTLRVNITYATRMDVDGEEFSVSGDSSEKFIGAARITDAERDAFVQNNNSQCILKNNETCSKHHPLDDSFMELESIRELVAGSIFSFSYFPNINYDVSLQEISFHIPLHRLLSLLLRKALKVCCLVLGWSGKTECTTAAGVSIEHEYFRKLLAGMHPYGFSAFIMEHPLQLRVYCAQVRAGMWRKNGDTAILCSEWYRSVQWFEQGLESDLFLLQCCAALAPPDLFVQRILERFGLSNYLFLNLADYNEYETVLVQEMLTLIIHIVKERRFCGLSVEENLHRELVYRLAIGDATHSQLVRSLPRDLSKNDKLQNVLDVLAAYCNPSGMKQGKYLLRKAYWKELDLYHPRWSSKDLQLAEERYFRFCKVSALNAQLPRWTPIIEPLTSVSRVATSKIVLQIVRAVLFYAFFSKSSSISRAPDAVLITALHLVSLALDICEAHRLLHIDNNPLPILIYASEECNVGSTNAAILWKNQSMLSLLVSLMRKCKEENEMYVETRQCNISSVIEVLLKRFAQLSAICLFELQRLAPDLVFDLPQVNISVQNLASTSDVDDRKAKVRQRQAAILEKMRVQQSKFIASLSSNCFEQETHKKKEPSPDNVKEEAVRICSLCHESDSGNPLCFLIFLQKSRLTTFVERGPPTWQDEGQKSKEIYSAGKGKLIDSSGHETSSQILPVQGAGHGIVYDFEPVDVDAFLNFAKEQIPDIGKFQLPMASSAADGDASFSLDLMEEHLFKCIIEDMLDRRSYRHGALSEQNYSTSLAAVDSHKGGDSGFVLGEYASCLTKKSSKLQNSSLYGLFHLGNLSPKPKITVNKISRFGPKDCDGVHISSCGHAVHQDCHERYLASLKQRNTRRLGFEGGHIIDPDLGELLCPVCRRFANSIVPAVYDKSGQHMKLSPSILEANKVLNLALALSLLQSADKVVGHEKLLKKYSGKFRENIEPSLGSILCKLCMLYYGYDFNDLLASGRLSQSLLLWDTLTYSLEATEIASRGRVRASSFGSNLEALYGELRSSSGFILSILLHVSKSTCCSSSLEVLLRFRGIQLMTGSICFGISRNNFLSNSDKRRGSFTFEHAERGESFPDIQFWKRVSDPILAHDPFSSLMCVLFCLPAPFMQFKEFFISLVHLFYAVCIIQSLITCYSKGCFDASNFCDSRVNDICKVMGESSTVKNYFGSKHVDRCHSKDTIRRLTFPFLRRCALLWKVVQSSTISPLYDISQVWEGLNPHAKAHVLEVETANYLRIELDEIRELEDLFHVSPLESLLKNELVYSLVLKWSKHLCDELSARKCGGMLYCTPVVPFKLMQLPSLYQDLLQRYVKLKCPECGSVPEEPALCLLCGKLCSPTWKYCCRASRCLNHANSCGAGIGAFLLVRRTTILLQRSSRQTMWSSPYLDAFGEEDIDMHRGKPLYFNEERYAALTYLVASHGLDQTSEVLRQTTISINGSD